MKLLCSIRRTGVFLSPWLSAAYVLRKKLLIFAGMKHIAKLLPITLAAAGLWACQPKDIIPEPVRVEELPEAEILAQVRSDVPNTAFYKDIFLDGGCELNPGIKEKGVVINGRLPYALAKAGIGDAEYFLATIDDVGDGWTQNDNDLQRLTMVGNPEDENGVLLYPDGQPRFRMVYIFGGHSNPHGSTLGADGRSRMKTFYENGGSYVGSCAGAFLAGAYANGGRRSYFNILYNGNMNSTDVSNSSIDMLIESDIFSKYYGPSKGTLVKGIRHNGGGYLDTGLAPEGTESLAIFKDEAGRNSSAKPYYNQPSVWAYKASEYSGRMVVTGSHPEDAPSGNILDLTASMFRYAWDGVGKAFVKEVLRSGDLIPVSPGIGDLQCHHFVLCPAADVKNLSISVSYQGDYDMEIYMKRGSFAFPDAAPEYSASASSEGRVTLTTGPVEKGLWYVTVRCATTVESKEIVIKPDARLGRYFIYYGRKDVLNGVPYSIQADWEY